MCVLQIPLWKIVSFAGEFTNKFIANGSKLYNKGVLEIIQVQYSNHQGYRLIVKCSIH